MSEAQVAGKHSGGNGSPAPQPSERPREAGRRTIADEVAALQRLHDTLGESFDAAAAKLIALEGNVLTLGVGKSGHAAQKVAATLRSVGLPALYLNASDSLHGDLGVVGGGDVGMLFSKSGSTRELMVLVPHLRARGVTLIAVVGSPGSPVAREADIVLDVSVEREGCPLDAAPMASVLAAQAVGDALAAAVTRARGFTSDDFARLHPAGALGARLTLTVNDVMRRGDELPLIDSGANMKEAVIEITRTGYGAVCVVDEEQRLVGFVTDGDVRRKLLEVDNLAQVGVTEAMTESPLTVAPELPLSQALLMLEQRKKAFLSAPVVLDGERCVGLLRLHDAVQAHLPS
jgi:arabinose-5-phosphate isomerase